MMGTELDELGEFDAEFIDNISKFVNSDYNPSSLFARTRLV